MGDKRVMKDNCSSSDKHGAFVMKGPQHIDLEDYSSKCKFGLYINQEDQEMKSSVKNNKSISSNKK